MRQLKETMMVYQSYTNLDYFFIQITTWRILKLICIGVDNGIGIAGVPSPVVNYMRRFLKVPKFQRITFWHL